MSDETMFFITKEQLDEFRAQTVKEAINAVRREESKIARQNSPVERAKAVLKSYRQLRIKYEEYVDSIEFSYDEQIELKYMFLEDLMGKQNMQSEITKVEKKLIDEEKNRRKNVFDLIRINEAADMYQTECERSDREDDKLKWLVLYYCYFDDQKRSMEEIADICTISKRTAFNYLNLATKSFAFYLFGMQ